MMKSMIAENGVTFKNLENIIYSWSFQIGHQFTSEFLEQYDWMLKDERDKSRYWHKGFRKTTIKTVYGEISYSRAVYETGREDGVRNFVYLLDKTLELASQRILNADGASWIKKVKDESTCFQMYTFHHNQATREKLHKRKEVTDVKELLEDERIDELFEYLKIYRDSLREEGK